MMGIVRAIIGLILAALFVIFAITNRHSVDVYWSPAHSAAHLPLYSVALGLMAAGFILGSLVTWFASLRLRLEKSKQKRRITVLEKELESLKLTSNEITLLKDKESL